MRILVISTNGIITDGITSWLLQNFTLMDKSGLEIETVAFDGAPQDALDILAAAAIIVHTLPTRKKQPGSYALALRQLIKNGSYDAIHVNGNSGTVALELLCCIGTPTKTRIVHSRNTSGEQPWLDRLLRGTMNRLTTHRVACGRDAGKWLFGDADFAVIPNGRDFPSYAFDESKRRAVREELGLSSDEMAVGHIGNFTEQKNHRFLIDSFAMALSLNPKLRLFLIGDGTLRHDMERRAIDREVAGQVSFIGRSNRVAEYLNAFDLAVLPSLYEGFPNVVIEWQVNGLPGLISSSVTDECAITDLVRIVPEGDLGAWARAIAGATPAERSIASATSQTALQAAGYEAHDSAERLRALYKTIDT